MTLTKEERKLYSRKHRRENPEKYATYARKRNYGVTQEWFDQKIKEQNGKCVICSCELLQPKVDHNHETGQPRALLCHSCNVMLGYAHEDPIRLAKAIEYLKKYEDNNGPKRTKSTFATRPTFDARTSHAGSSGEPRRLQSYREVV